MNLTSYISSFSNEIDNIDETVRDIIERNSGKILSVIKLRMYQSGIAGDGQKITPEYSPITITRKKGKGQISSHVTLRNTGEWYKSFYIDFIDGEVIVKSDSSKTEDLTAKYGDSILELTEQEVELIVLSIIEPELFKVLNNIKQINIDL
jgi:hypothetical protein